MDTNQLITLMSAGGGGAVLLALVSGIVKWVSGSSARERQRNTSLETQRIQAIEERNRADNERRIAEEERRKADQARWEAEEDTSILRRQLIDEGIIPRIPKED